MRSGAVATLTTFVAAGLFVISQPSCNLIETRQDGASGGSAGGSSTSASGGAGGVKSSGGTTSSGGGGGSGGTPSSSGGSGGAGGTASGGSGGSGGTSSSVSATGRGGQGNDAGGAPSGGSGGKAGAGGSAGAGGTTPSGGSTTTSVGNCTDDPPPGQTPTCAEWNSYGMCSQSWFATYCNRTCGRCSGGSQGGAGGSGGSSAKGGAGGAGGVGGSSSSGGVSGSGGTTAKGGSGGSGGGASGPGTTNPQISGTNGWASRYWDCCKPSCAWSANSNPPVPACQKDGATRVSADAKNGCEGGGSAYECYDFSPWYDASTNMSYGFVAYNGVACGTCFELQFNGNGNSGPNTGASALKGQQMIVQVINIGGLQANQFDILIPGGGVGAMTAGCTAQWGSVDLGVTYGGLLSECSGDCSCMKGKCSSVFGNMASSIRNGCDWFTSWFSCADNPQLAYKQVSCPSQLTNKTGLSK